ncbi:MAG TPA: DUF1499 domain-containing protein [Xanthobacteraceae bacterium]|jgi:uncharacterized protein (DUF1499 family)
MRRRTFIEEPPSRLAIWALRIGFFSLAATVLAIIIVRSGVLEIRPALATVAGALAFAAIAVLLAFAAFAVIWKDGLKGMGSAVGAIAIGVGLLAYPAYLGIKGYKLPWIYDITTDPIDPPRYEALARIRPRDANPIIYAGLSAAQQQRAAYPDIEPLEEEASPKAAYDAAVAVITRRKWTVLLKRPPEARRDGQIEAVARTPILGFRDDVVVRIRAIPDGSRIDMRSSSRYGRFDFGSNASRIRKLLDDIDDTVGEQKPEPPVTPPPKKQKAPPKGNQPSARR